MPPEKSDPRHIGSSPRKKGIWHGGARGRAGAGLRGLIIKRFRDPRGSRMALGTAGLSASRRTTSRSSPSVIPRCCSAVPCRRRGMAARALPRSWRWCSGRPMRTAPKGLHPGRQARNPVHGQFRAAFSPRERATCRTTSGGHHTKSPPVAPGSSSTRPVASTSRWATLLPAEARSSCGSRPSRQGRLQSPPFVATFRPRRS